MNGNRNGALLMQMIKEDVQNANLKLHHEG